MRRDLTPDVEADLIRAAHALADAARPPTLRHFRQRIVADDKASGLAGARFDPVTEADREAERAMRDVLSRERPRDGVVGEEYGSHEGTSGLTWVLDPIDGTRGYVAGTPTWGVLVAVADADGPFFGIIDQPYTDERFEGGLGRALLTGARGTTVLRTGPARPLGEATVLTTFPEIGSQAERAAFERLASRARLVRYGMDCYGYALLAAGHVDLVVEAGLQPYDVHAPIAVVSAAGGLATGWDGRPAHRGGQLLAAANAAIHAEAMAWLAG